MKKRFLFPLIAAAGISAFAALANEGNKMNQQYLADCNAGQTEICAKVFNGTSVKKDMITNKEHLDSLHAAKIAEANLKIAKAKAKAERLKVLAARENQSKLAAAKANAKKQKEAWVLAAEKHEIKMRWGCEDAIKSGLKDPRSYQANDVNYWPSMAADPALVMVKINYTAKNGFGGATRGNAVCHADANGNILEAKYL